jgi:GntR family transcriptional regulator of vanillate catabolism
VEIEGAIEVRGVLEGLAARRLATGGVDTATAAAMQRCLDDGNAIFAKGSLDDGDLEQFYAYNLMFHELLVRASGNPAIGIALVRNNHLPFASAAALALDWQNRAAEYQHLLGAHEQHHAVADAIRRGDADTAEAIMRDHARMAIGSTGVFERFGIEAAGRSEGAEADTILM